MKILLGATVALLFGAIVVSWQGMKSGVENASPDEIARIKQQIYDELKADLKAEAVPEMSEQQLAEEAALKAKLALAQEQIDALEATRKAEEDALRDAKLKQDEEGLIAQKMLESNDSELKRARLIGDALLMGRVKEYVEDPDYGGFITIEVLMPEQVQVGTILGIRRKTGILGRFKVSDISPEGAIASPLPGPGPIDPKPGDELIFPPQY